MQWCVAVDCSNNTFTKTREKDASFYNLPKNVNLTQRWIPYIKRENIYKNLQIFHRHFEESCFKRDLEIMFFFFMHELLSISLEIQAHTLAILWCNKNITTTLSLDKDLKEK